uniref:NADH-ubiquinone oxidoreductase chain 4L n=1 Tax=Thylacodes squamigerus TaxID=766170 RepID=E2FLV3_9CAEN|nr:NADH dehydrogenase subunit 4L [Thylacodes squamigerus]ADI79419.1 NADH dehydrogenase subunit 4L [Thylacodes squamigerus]
MEMFYLAISVIGFTMSILALALQYKHLLGALLSLEAAMLNLFVLLLSFMSSSVSAHSVLIFITLSACEASLGLAVLVSALRAHGNDYVASFSTHKC